MAAIKDAAAIATKWARVTPSRTTDYTEGVQNPRRSWAQATTQAKGAYEEGVTQAIARDAYARGVNAAGDAKWQTNTAKKGSTRWGEGVRLSEQAYAQGFEPSRQIIASTTLPPRGPRGDQRNIDRVAVLARALHEGRVRRA